MGPHQQRIMEQAVEHYLLDLELTHAKSSIRTHRATLRLVSAGLPVPPSQATRRHLKDWLRGRLETASKSTVQQDLRRLRVFYAWLIEEGERDDNPTEGLKTPTPVFTPRPVVSQDEFKALLATCRTNNAHRRGERAFCNRRDEAILRLLLDSGPRLNEITGIRLKDLEDMCVRVMGKGSRPRTIPFGAATAKALRRYLRARSRHPRAGSEFLWLSSRGPLKAVSLHHMILRRCREAGLRPISPHQFRHAFAHEWLKSSGKELDLMKLAGWRSRAMLERYGAILAESRAIEAHRELGLGNRY